MGAKEKLRERVESLSEEEASEALRLLAEGEDPVLAAFRNAPLDDEPFTEEDEAAVAEAEEDFVAGRTVTHDEIKREFGIE